MKSIATLTVFIALSLLPDAAFAKPKEKEICLYPTRSGEVRQASSLDDVPRESRAYARCGPANQNSNLAKPDEIKLNGNVRVEQINSSIGTIKLRWPRSVESLFGRTPLRATTDTAKTVSRAVKNNAFPTHVQNLNLEWNVIFLDENLPEGQIPTTLVTNCHPGWMTPPANIYIVAQRVAGGCGTQRSTTSVADSMLADVLLHEMGHAVEFYLLDKHNSNDRVRAEGFATWWERYASQYSSILNQREIEARQFEAARYSFKQNPGALRFQGSFEDYSRASMFFTVISGPRGLPGLMDVYKQMNERGTAFIPAILSEMNWDDRRLQKEIEQALR